MFPKIRYQLLLSYIAVLASILGIFASVIHVVFTRSLSQEFKEKLTTLAQGAAANTEFEQGDLKVGDDFSTKDLIAHNQALEWFDLQGHIIAQQGKYVLTLPLVANQPVQIQTGKVRIQGVTLPIINTDNGHLVSYVRASQSMDALDHTIEKLNLGLGIGIAIALIISSISGIWLTRQAMQPIERSFQRLKQFTADASHELPGSLMAIKSNAAVALKYLEGMRATDVEKFTAIASATNQVTRLTEDLLFLARVEQMPIADWATINLEELLNNLLLLYKPQAETKQINVLTNLNTANSYLCANQVQLTRLFANLIENALQYTPVGGKIEITINKIDRYFLINVKDNGIGIASEYLECIFDRFWRANQSRSYSEGAGLGLAIAQAIALRHGGSITVTSQLEVGSCFTVSLSVAASPSSQINNQ